MQVQAKLSAAPDVLPFRERYREEMNCQIVHDSIHRRAGWTLTYLLESAGVAVGFGSVALGGPWKDKPTLFEFYVLPEHRTRAFDICTAVLEYLVPIGVVNGYVNYSRELVSRFVECDRPAAAIRIR